MGLSADEVRNLVRLVVKAAGDDEAESRLKAVEATVAKFVEGDVTTGWPKVTELLGPDFKGLITSARKWLGDTVDAAKSGKIDTILASEVTSRRVEWFWPDRIAYGSICILDGDPGTGKSTIALDLAARQSNGGDLPFGGACEQFGVVVLTSEDSLDTTVVPRLRAAGAHLDKIALVRGVTRDHDRHDLVSIPEDTRAHRSGADG